MYISSSHCHPEVGLVISIPFFKSVKLRHHMLNKLVLGSHR